MPDSFDTRLQAARDARRDGRLSDALLGYAGVADDARASGDLPSLVHALRHVSEIERKNGHPDRALTAGEEAVAACRTIAAPALDFANALRVAALALDASDRKSEAGPLWQEARARYLQAGVSEGVDECDIHLRPVV
ncbi:MAG: hypothetical protein V4459_00710 [Pseudomonadota bacterium]